LPGGFFFGSVDDVFEVVLPVDFGAADFGGADFVSGFFAGCDAPATLAPARPGAAVISAFSANSFT
jgi:hypothetical protein